MTEVNDLVLSIIKRPPAEQFNLAFKVAENIGYRLVPILKEDTMPEWENIYAKHPYISRFAVPGGWLYRVSFINTSIDQIVFVPDTMARDAALMAAFGKRSDDTNH